MTSKHVPLRGLRCLTLAISAGMLLVACNSDASDANTPGVVKNMPPIHLEQTAELLIDGENAARAAYMQAADACEAGGIPTRRLSASEVELVGVTRYEMWLDGTSETTQTRAWDAGQESPDALCQFRLELSGTFSSSTADTFVEQDLATGQREEQTVAAEPMQRFAIAAQDEQAPEGFRGPVAKQVAGQPCEEWTTPDDNRFCVWSGGRAWGFGSTRGDDYRPSSNGIVLEAEPANGNGYRVVTQVLSAGQAFAAPTAATEKRQ